MPEIKSGKNEFYMEEDGEVIAQIQFIPSGKNKEGKELLTVTHTIVSPEHNGQGLGKQLVNHIAEFAREENKYIIPECSYAKKVLESKEEYQDVLAN